MGTVYRYPLKSQDFSMSSSTARSFIEPTEFSGENGRRSSGSRRPNAARERSRIQNLRDAFQSLQSALPAVPPSTKLSKLDVLLMASAYIAHLSRLVEENGQQDFAIPGGQIVAFHPVKVILMMINHDYISSCLVIAQKWPMRARLYAGLNYSGSRGPYEPPKACSHHHSADNPM